MIIVHVCVLWVTDYLGVVDVMPNSLMKPETTHSWDYLGLSYSHEAPNLLSKSNMRDGTIIGVIDSGLSDTHNILDLRKMTNHALNLQQYAFKWMVRNLARIQKLQWLRLGTYPISLEGHMQVWN